MKHHADTVNLFSHTKEELLLRTLCVRQPTLLFLRTKETRVRPLNFLKSQSTLICLPSIGVVVGKAPYNEFLLDRPGVYSQAEQRFGVMQSSRAAAASLLLLGDKNTSDQWKNQEKVKKEKVKLTTAICFNGNATLKCSPCKWQHFTRHLIAHFSRQWT